MKNVFYARVSSTTQNIDRQIETFKKMEGFRKDVLFVDICSGNVEFMSREEALKLWDYATSSEESVRLVVDSIDRLGRNLRDILSTVEGFTNSNICIRFLKDGFETLREDGTKNPTANMLIAMMGSIAQMERERIKERQLEGIAVAKAKGVYSENGRKKKGKLMSDDDLLKRHSDVILKLNQGLSYREVAKITGKSTRTITKLSKLIR